MLKVNCIGSNLWIVGYIGAIKRTHTVLPVTKMLSALYTAKQTSSHCYHCWTATVLMTHTVPAITLLLTNHNKKKRRRIPSHAKSAYTTESLNSQYCNKRMAKCFWHCTFLTHHHHTHTHTHTLLPTAFTAELLISNKHLTKCNFSPWHKLKWQTTVSSWQWL
jgi:hypothetical protein